MKDCFRNSPLMLFVVLILWGSPSKAQITPADAAAQMVKGINLGNTLEPPAEGGWNNPKAQEYYFDLYKEAGFSCVRIPVRWDEHTLKTPPYTVNDTWMNRVEEIVDWGLKRGLFIVINAHHEEWIKSNYSQINRDRFDSIWSQISVRFKNKSEKLLFEVINEPYGLSKAQTDDLHKRILSVIRKTNPTRIVIFQGHNWGGSSELIQAAIPNDPYIMGSFHSYDPYLFGLEGQGTWGSTGDYNALKAKFQEVENWSAQNNIPVFLGEFGSLRSCDYNSRMRHYSAYVEYSRLFGFVPCAWDDGGDFRIMLRNEKNWDEVKDILVMSSDGSPANIAVKVQQDSIVYLSWINRAANCDSIIIQRRTTSSSYANIATLPNNTTNFLDVKPFMNQYYHYRIIARSKSGQEYYSYPQRVFFPSWKKRIRQPYLGSPVEIPGTVEAENFDLGGEGLGYHDVDDVNIAGAYRPNEAVDIYDRNGTGYHIGNALPGEWYEYLITVKTRGTYKIDIALAAISGGGKFLLKAGNSISDTLKALTSYSWLTTKNVSTTLFLEEGEQLLRFSVIDDPLFNIDRFTFELLTGSHLISEAPGFEIHAWQNEGNELVIRLNLNKKRVNLLRIFTTDGKLVYCISQPYGEIILPAGQLPRGIYIIQAFTNQDRWSKKLYVN